MSDFIHLHNHSHYSLLDGACRLEDLIGMAKEYEMPAISLTDHGNMFGAVEFYQKAVKKDIKPIIGSEVYVAPTSRHEKKSGLGHSFHLVLLCKNDEGYKNLMRLVSAGYTEGFYYKPRVDKDLLRELSGGLVALSACLKGEVPSTYLREGEEKAMEMIDIYRSIFKDDFYLEVQNHGIPEEDTVRDGIFKMAEHMDVKVVGTNDIHYLKKDHNSAHDVLLCLQTGKDYDDPKRMRYTTNELYFKNYDEMAQLFPGHSEVLENTLEVADKCNLEMSFNNYLIPEFEIPKEDDSEDLGAYLTKLAHEGLRERYDEITPELEQRLDYELGIINQMGYPGYFLITADFIKYARDNDIPVGPGRGSAAGSLVSYCLQITNLDPMKYSLIFERFLNPERVSMPDIDIDFCYEQREDVITYVKEKYGYNNVCQIITFGTMAARAVIRDVGRVLKLSYGEVDKIAKLVPSQLNIKLKEAIDTVSELKDLTKGDQQQQQLMEYSQVLEGLARHASTHAAGVVITPKELTNYVPLYKTKDGDITTQYDMKVLDDVGLLKMDFLGLRTLTVIDKAVKNIKRTQNIDIDIDNLPLDDKKVYELFSAGGTIGVFQFESSGMQEYLKKLQPTCLEDLIAMNSLYRPGPMDFIDDFIQRKKDPNKIVYLHPLLEPILNETYGIAVYQEQVMKMASDVANFSLGAADILRRAMGKKKVEEMVRQRQIFVDGAAENGVDADTANKIFDMMEKFAGYGFNKSHAACYSLVAYQTAYLKAHYPAEFMAATISSEMGTTSRVTILLEECKRMGLNVLPPDVNESYADFVVTPEGIRFGMGAIKNVGVGAINSMVEARKQHGKFKTIFDIGLNTQPGSVNRKVLESLAQAGAMDSLEGTRAQKFEAVETAIDFCSRVHKQSSKNQESLFGADDESQALAPPSLPTVEPWPQTETLKKEKALLGFFLSGHPLDRFRDEVKAFSTVTLDSLEELRNEMPVRLCGIVTEFKKHFTKKNQAMAFLKLEDYTGNIEGVVFPKTYEKFSSFLEVDKMVMVMGKIDASDGSDPKILIDEIITMEDARKRYTKNLCLALDTTVVSDEDLENIKNILEQNKGAIPVYINLKSPGNGDYVLRSNSIKVQPSLELVEQLRSTVGRENVWVGA